LALLSAGAGIHYFYEESQDSVISLGVLSALFSCGALYRLYKTIGSVEYAALRQARTVEFNAVYGSGKKSAEIELGKETNLIIAAGTKDMDLECVVIDFFLPPEIELKKILTLDAYGSLQPEQADYPKYMMVTREKGFTSRETFVAVHIIVCAKNIGDYKIPIEISAKGVYQVVDRLSLKVVKEPPNEQKKDSPS
jgi:hypothetical protein